MTRKLWGLCCLTVFGLLKRKTKEPKTIGSPTVSFRGWCDKVARFASLLMGQRSQRRGNPQNHPRTLPIFRRNRFDAGQKPSHLSLRVACHFAESTPFWLVFTWKPTAHPPFWGGSLKKDTPVYARGSQKTEPKKVAPRRPGAHFLEIVAWQILMLGSTRLAMNT